MFNCRSCQFYPSSNQLCPVLSIITQSSILVSLSTSLTQFSITSLLLSSWAIQTLLLFQGVNISCCKSVSLVVLGFLSLLFRQSLEGRIAIGLCDNQEDTLYLDIYIHKVAVSLEVVGVLGVIEAEERDSVGHHPDVAAAAVVVRLVPLPVLVAHRQYRLLCTAFLTFLYYYQLHYSFFS